MIFCKKCGKENDNDANFCIHCGNKLVAEKIEATARNNKKKSPLNGNINNKVSKFITGIVTMFRYFIGFPIMFAGIGLLLKNASIGCVFFVILGFIITPIYSNKLNGKKRFYVGAAAFLLALIFDPIAENNKTIQVDNDKTIKAEINKGVSADNSKQTASDNDKKQDSAVLSGDKLPPLPTKIDVKINTSSNNVKASYDPNVLDIIPTQKGKGWDKTINKYGINGVKKINELLPKAAELMSQNPTCDKLAYVAHSDKGTPSNIVVFGNCNNGARFYLSEKEITEKHVPLSRKQRLKQMELQFINACDDIVKSRLNYPSTFDKSLFRSGVSTDENKTTVLVGFSAKNGFNLELKYKAVCIFNDTPELVSFSMEEEQ